MEGAALLRRSSKPFRSFDIPLRKAMLAPMPIPPKVAVSNQREFFLLRVRIESCRLSAGLKSDGLARHDRDAGIRERFQNALQPVWVGHSIVVQV